MKKEIKTRFAPSPTGLPHLGSIKAALLPYWFGKSKNGKFILRIDNTDKERSKKEYEEAIFDMLKWMEISYDKTFEQLSRIKEYDKYFEQLRSENKIYECFETEEDLREFTHRKRLQKKPPLFSKKDRFRFSGESYWRFELPEGPHIIDDLIFGKLTFQKEWSDPIIKKPNKDYTYTFSSVVDDISEGITHIIRGFEHISNGVIQQIIGMGILNRKWDIEFAHYPIFLEKDGSKMSKRNQSLSYQSLRENNIQKAALWNFIFHNGSSHKKILSGNQEDYIKNFNISSYSKSSQKFIYEDLLKYNKKIFKVLNDKHIMENNFDMDFWKVIRENVDTIEDFYNSYEKIKKFINSNKEIQENIDKSHMKNFYIETIGKECGPPIVDLINFIKKRRKFV